MSTKSTDDWEGLAGDAAGPIRKPQCHVAMLLEGLPEAGRLSVSKALADSSLTSSGIHRALLLRLPEGRVPSEASLQRHRREVCSC